MPHVAKMNSAAEPGSNLHAIKSDIAALKRDLAAVVRGMKVDFSAEIAGAGDAVGQIGDEAQRIYENLAAQSERSVKAIGRQVEQRPVTLLLLAVAIGFLGSRMLSR